MSRSSAFAKVPARVSLYLLATTCIGVSFVLRTAMSITILAMVKEGESSEYLAKNDSKCNVRNDLAVTYKNYGGTFDWSIDVQYFILTSCFWTYIGGQVLGGITAHKFGAKIVIGIGMFTSTVCNLFIPLGSEVNYLVVIVLQLLHGLGLGVVWPALYSLVSWWIPKHEQARFLTCLQGLSIGMSISLLMSGFLIASLGWKYVFYVSGMLGALWCLAWYFFAFDKPELHPRMQYKELHYISKHRKDTLSADKRIVPWKSIFLCLPVWAIAISQFGRMWFSLISNTYGPLYLKSIIGLGAEMNGLCGGIINFGTFIFAIIFSYVADKLLAYDFITIKNIRKLFTGIGMFLPGACCLLINHLGCDKYLNMTVWAFSQMLTSACFPGAMVNIVDIAPNLTGSVTSVIQVVLLLPGIFGTYVAKSLFKSLDPEDAWHGIFYSSSLILFITCLFYLAFASADAQVWDYKIVPTDSEGQELRQQLAEDKEVRS
ncbi:sialin-like [Photinus pyralis]|uniref:sialin-like n=1 Tax=Photinus pyralis TaxID=7054 RepID=UPI0012676CC7|nr:sialin-like [Photinus pyralis]XP_031354483.1 sialin-like [Photinus pyralis]XP_031354484.1 sialin-like [Photinus pyralis]XP_031355450.1 sialin-like [Photinus pyralis]XP_031355451.1 sialin-like [Photinus pyralis]XP_031355452.1 sialin-like [Photinus pyralis]